MGKSTANASGKKGAADAKNKAAGAAANGAATAAAPPAPGDQAAPIPPAATDQAPNPDEKAPEGAEQSNDGETTDTSAAATDQAPSPDDKDPEGAELTDPIPGLWIRAVPEEGRRRAGFRFEREGMGIALSALSDETIQALRDDPLLIVADVQFSDQAPN